MQCRESERRGGHCYRCQTYLIPKNHALPDATAFGNGDNIHVWPRVDELLVNRINGTGKVDVDVEVLENESFEDNDENNSRLS